MNEKLHTKVSPPFEGGVVGRLIIIYLQYLISQPGWLIHSLPLTFIGVKNKTSLIGKVLNFSVHNQPPRPGSAFVSKFKSGPATPPSKGGEMFK